MRALVLVLAVALCGAAAPPHRCAQQLAAATGSAIDPAFITHLVEAHSAVPDTALVLAVIAAESGFNAGAKSSANALGLMQVTDLAMLDAAVHCNRSPVPLALLYDATTNIIFGTCYLKKALALTGHEYEALLIYNGGYRQWEKYKAGKRIAAETQAYVNRVLALKNTHCRKV